MTPLQKLLLDPPPLKPDGSDKFFGMENVSLLVIRYAPCVVDLVNANFYRLNMPIHGRSLKPNTFLIKPPVANADTVIVIQFFSVSITPSPFENPL